MKFSRTKLLVVISCIAFNVQADTVRSQLESWAMKAKSVAADAKEVAEDKIAEIKKNYDLKKPVDEPAGEYHFDVKAKDNGDGTAFIDYGFFTVNYSCLNRGFNYINYTTVKDQGDISRYEPFHKESALNSVDNCDNQITTSSYKKKYGQPQYHRGHGVHQNIWDHDEKMMFMTNAMTNIVPHNGIQNVSGLWRRLEERIECARDKTEVEVYLGNNWGNDASNDHFVRSHGVKTPDRLWRVHVYKSHPNTAFAWLIPNDEVAKRETEENYRVSLSELKKQLSDEYSWPIPSKWVSAGKKLNPYKNIRCSFK